MSSKSLFVFLTALALTTLVVSPTALAEGKDVQWSVTASMNMVKPMAMKMPSYTVKTCAAEDAEDGPPPMKNGDCKVENFEKKGIRYSYKVVCDQQGSKMVGEGWTEKPDRDHYNGEMNLTGESSGMPIEMSMTYKANRIGSCTAKD